MNFLVINSKGRLNLFFDILDQSINQKKKLISIFLLECDLNLKQKA